MQLDLPDASISMEWPDTVSTETLLFIEEVLTIQRRSVRRALERRKNEDQIPLPLAGAMTGADHG